MDKFKKFIKASTPYVVGVGAGIVCVASGVIIGVTIYGGNKT